MNTYMYYLTIGAVFKNESHILNEWIEHYRFHGIDHIYLVNDNSSDDFMQILQPYIDIGYVTFYTNTLVEMREFGRQQELYAKYFRQHLKETHWFGILDLDEFLYSPTDKIDIKQVLSGYETETQIESNWVHFGSSGHINQPEKVVSNFLYRGSYNSHTNGPNGRYNSYKSIVNVRKLGCENITLDIHRHKNDRGEYMDSRNLSFELSEPVLLINHYCTQSLEFWKKVKMSRGDINYYYDSQNWKRDLQLFELCNQNTDILDDRLWKQNANI